MDASALDPSVPRLTDTTFKDSRGDLLAGDKVLCLQACWEQTRPHSPIPAASEHESKDPESGPGLEC